MKNFGLVVMRSINCTDGIEGKEFSVLTIFIQWSIIVIAGSDERASSCSSKISSSMILQVNVKTN